MDFPVWIPQSPLQKTANDEFVITDTLLGGTSITAISSKIYLGTSDKTSENMTGTGSYAANTYTTPKIASLKGGNVYVVATTVTIDGYKATRKMELRVQKVSDLQ